jgi:hypothetical protein
LSSAKRAEPKTVTQGPKKVQRAEGADELEADPDRAQQLRAPAVRALEEHPLLARAHGLAPALVRVDRRHVAAQAAGGIDAVVDWTSGRIRRRLVAVASRAHAVRSLGIEG